MNLALDLDGTLISCEPRQSAVLQAALAQVGAQADLIRAGQRKRAGDSTEQALVEQGLDKLVARRVAGAWRQMIEAPHWLAFDQVLPGVRETLHAMRAGGFKLRLLTARSRPEWVPQELARLGLAPLLDEVIVVPAERASEAKAAVLRESSPIAFFGDTESDWRASTAAGVPFYAVASGQRSAEFLTGAGIDPVHEDLAAAWAAGKTDLVREQRS